MRAHYSKILAIVLIAIIAFIFGFDNTKNANNSLGVKMSQNRLANEKSPYLLQHADNPVDWYPWGEEAFSKAAKEDKPIFLSIGYSTCHWCHVMEHESFEDAEVAALMNEVFVCIKVDREERPDIDNIYMMACQLATGSGGWPLTIIMTPDKKPFMAATYIPKHQRFGRPGMMDLIPKIKDFWENRREDVLQVADKMTHSLGQLEEDPGKILGDEELQIAYRQLASRFDGIHGGFGQAPKFPTPHNLLFLLRSWKRTGEPHALDMVEKTLQDMRKGGIYDHVGYGFHRYSTDQRWFLPHFEKMLYDQALLLMAYTEAFQATGKEEYRTTANEICTYILRDMTDGSGGFYSAEDADSEGEEGKFYLWTAKEIILLLGAKDAAIVEQVFGLSEEGNYQEEAGSEGPTGQNIFFLERPVAEVSTVLGISEEKLRERLEKIRGTLFAEREKRIHPYKDDKILTDWNGLMIAALAKAARAFDEPRYAASAEKAADFILQQWDKNRDLVHRFRQGEWGITANIDDYAFLIWGLIELYEATFELKYLKASLELADDAHEHFWDEDNGGFFFTSDSGEELIIRSKEIYDGAVPSGNSVMMLNLLRLGKMTGRVEFEEKAELIGRAFQKNVSQAAAIYTQLLSAVDFGIGPSYEVVIVGKQNGCDTELMRRSLEATYIPNKVVLFKPLDESSQEIVRIAPFTGDHKAIEGKTTAYVCMNYACAKPTTDANEMKELLGNSEQ
jgi:uncharacterized protein YyaL (SSP411 family)